jgi:hypothetical protein
MIEFTEGDIVAWMGQKYLVKEVDGTQVVLMDMYGARVYADYDDCTPIVGW